MKDELIIKISAQDLTEEFIQAAIKMAKKRGYKRLSFLWEALIGPYLNIDLEEEFKDS
jgi:hypothetical protein